MNISSEGRKKKMTEREMIMKILERVGQEVYSDANNYIEFENGARYGENISIDFDDEGNILAIY